MFPIDFEVKRSKVKLTGHQSRNTVSELQTVIFTTQSHHITHTDYPWKENVPYNFEVKRSKIKQTGHLSRNTKSRLQTIILITGTYSRHITHIDYPWEENVPYRIQGQKVSGQAHWTSKQKYGFLGLECYAFHLETPYHTYGLPMEGRCSLLNLGVKRSMVKCTGH